MGFVELNTTSWREDELHILRGVTEFGRISTVAIVAIVVAIEELYQQLLSTSE